MAISSDIRMEQYWDDDHREDALHIKLLKRVQFENFPLSCCERMGMIQQENVFLWFHLYDRYYHIHLPDIYHFWLV